MSYYGMGDYYRGDYYRGDAVFFPMATPVLKAAGGAVARGIGKAAGSVARGIGGLLGIGRGRGATAGTLAAGAGVVAGVAQRAVAAVRPPPPGQLPVPGLKGATQRFLPFGESGYYTRKRMNPANPKALRRALRRVSGFAKLAQRAKRDIQRAATAAGVKTGGARSCKPRRKC